MQAILCTHKHEEEEALDEKLGVPPIEKAIREACSFLKVIVLLPYLVQHSSAK